MAKLQILMVMPGKEGKTSSIIRFERRSPSHIFSVTVKPKVFKKLEDAQADFPMWVAAIAGKLGEATEKGFILADPNIQVFEKKPKEPKPAPSESVS